MIVEVPFVYDAPAREPGKRKYNKTKLRGSTAVLIREIDAADFHLGIELQNWDRERGAYVTNAEIRVRDGDPYAAMLGFGGQLHMTPETLREEVAAGKWTPLLRGIEKGGPTYSAEAEARLQFEPGQAGDREEVAALIARNAQDMVSCNGLVWRLMKDELLLVAHSPDRFNAPFVMADWRKSLLFKEGPLDCGRHFRLDQLPEALLALGLDVDPEDPTSFQPYVLHLPVIHDHSLVCYRHDQGPAFRKAACVAVSRFDPSGDTPEVVEAVAAFNEALRFHGPLLAAADLAAPFKGFVDAVAEAHGEQRVDKWRRELEKWEASPNAEAEPAPARRLAP